MYVLTGDNLFLGKLGGIARMVIITPPTREWEILLVMQQYGRPVCHSGVRESWVTTKHSNHVRYY